MFKNAILMMGMFTTLFATADTGWTIEGGIGHMSIETCGSEEDTPSHFESYNGVNIACRYNNEPSVIPFGYYVSGKVGIHINDDIFSDESEMYDVAAHAGLYANPGNIYVGIGKTSSVFLGNRMPDQTSGIVMEVGYDFSCETRCKFSHNTERSLDSNKHVNRINFVYESIV
tara:strand:+ start:84 stop:599 length:516 start_codon:yes stop_codon:yes gene_type:complete